MIVSGGAMAHYVCDQMKTVGSSVSYKVDAQGRRVRKTVGSTVAEYCYLGATVIAEKTGSGGRRRL
jgi:hypothetical protein